MLDKLIAKPKVLSEQYYQKHFAVFRKFYIIIKEANHRYHIGQYKYIDIKYRAVHPNIQQTALVFKIDLIAGL